MKISTIADNNITNFHGNNTTSQAEENNSFTGLLKEKSQQLVAASTEVSISDTARQKSQEQSVQADEVIQGKADKKDNKKNYPVEYYRVPDWLPDMFTVVLSPNLGQKGSDLLKEDNKINLLSASEQAYYRDAREQHWKAFLEETGIDSLEKHYQVLIADKASSEQYRVKWEERLSSDTQLMAIYAKGKRLSG